MTAPAPAEIRVTPMIAQYLEIKLANPDCLLFYRMGDFYEMFFQDAEIASQALGIVLTKRGKHQGADILMCGVPVERADDYLSRLIRLGHRVAICDQTEDPALAKKRGAKSVVRRDVVRIVTPGTLSEDQLLEARRPNVLAAVARLRQADGDWAYGIAGADISTGDCRVCEAGALGLAAALSRMAPSEIVAAPVVLEDPIAGGLLRQSGAPVSALRREGGDWAASQARVCDFYGVSTLDGLGAFSRLEVLALANLFAYVDATQLGPRPGFGPPSRGGAEGLLEIDHATRQNLELTRALTGSREGSLLGVIDCCKTAAGSRLLHERLGAPLAAAPAIMDRLDFVGLLVDQADLRGKLRAALARAPDIQRAMGRLALERGGPRDLAAIRDGLRAAAEISSDLRAAALSGAELAGVTSALASLDAGMVEAIDSALAENLPVKLRDGEFIRAGRIAELDQTRELRDESRRVVAALQRNYAEETGVRQLKIKHNQFLGYFIETSQAHGAALLGPQWRGRFAHRQTMADTMRFQTAELAELQTRIAAAVDHALALETALFHELVAQLHEQRRSIQQAAAAMAVVDVAAALAETAAASNWTRPRVDHTKVFQVAGARHPFVEAALRQKGGSFVANDAQLSDDAGTCARIALVTGPNMAGKSTFLRQNALIVVLAQMGSFVPARAAHIGVVDRLFSRVGAADDLAQGRSTFMVEMVETAAILNQSTDRSFVILDEIGRGTATYDGLSIAWATVEHLHDQCRCRALFATHFHELTRLAGHLPRVANFAMRVRDWNGELVFLHEVAPGVADRSYGVQVAKLAGLPAPVVQRARALLAQFEASDRGGPKAPLADLPLFAAPPVPPPPPSQTALAAALEEADPDEMSPREALELVYKLKTLLHAGAKPARRAHSPRRPD